MTEAAVVAEPQPAAYTKAFSQICVADVAIAGGKGANLGELTRAGFPVPEGFVITAQAYLQALNEGGLRERMRTLSAGLDVEDVANLKRVSQELRELVQRTAIPRALTQEILEGYRALGKAARVAVRSACRCSG